jgi:Homing endonuclease associated repeat
MRKLVTKEEILKTIQECAKELGHAPSIGELLKMSPIHKAAIYRKFGNYQNALALCGLERSGPGYQTEMRDVFLDWAGIARSLGKLPTMAEYEARGKYSIQPLLRRFGIWGDVPAGLLKYMKKEGLEKEWNDVTEIIARGRRSLRGPIRRSVSLARLMEDRPVYGTPLTFSPLTYAPTHEGGVIFLFGAMAHELGFAVSRIQPDFPDCEAMREVRPGQWQRVRVEFEFESRNFLAHGHAVAGCDVIVCWNNNWEDCPLEVVELKSVFRQKMLAAGGGSG